MKEMKEERRPRPLLSYASQVDANCTYPRESICPVSPLGSHCAVSASVLHIVREVTINHPDGGELINLASFLPLMEEVRKVIPRYPLAPLNLQRRCRHPSLKESQRRLSALLEGKHCGKEF